MGGGADGNDGNGSTGSSGEGGGYVRQSFPVEPITILFDSNGTSVSGNNSGFLIIGGHGSNGGNGSNGSGGVGGFGAGSLSAGGTGIDVPPVQITGIPGQAGTDLLPFGTGSLLSFGGAGGSSFSGSSGAGQLSPNQNPSFGQSPGGGGSCSPFNQPGGGGSCSPFNQPGGLGGFGQVIITYV